MTKMAISHKLDPLDLRLLKLSWPGVSMIKSPGTFTSTFRIFWHLFTSYSNLAFGKKVAPICWVIPPASPSWTFVRRILSNKVVFPVSTWPKIQQTGLLYSPSRRANSSLSSFRYFSSLFLFLSFLYSSSFISFSVFSFTGDSSFFSSCFYASFAACSFLSRSLYIFSFCFLDISNPSFFSFFF